MLESQRKHAAFSCLLAMTLAVTGHSMQWNRIRHFACLQVKMDSGRRRGAMVERRTLDWPEIPESFWRLAQRVYEPRQ